MQHLQKQAAFLPSARFLSTYQKSIKILCFSREKDTQDPAQGAITRAFLMPEVGRDEAGHCPKPEPEELFCGKTSREEGPMPFISQFYLSSPPQKQSREGRMLQVSQGEALQALMAGMLAVLWREKPAPGGPRHPQPLQACWNKANSP